MANFNQISGIFLGVYPYKKMIGFKTSAGHDFKKMQKCSLVTFEMANLISQFFLSPSSLLQLISILEQFGRNVN